MNKKYKILLISSIFLLPLVVIFTINFLNIVSNFTKTEKLNIEIENKTTNTDQQIDKEAPKEIKEDIQKKPKDETTDEIPTNALYTIYSTDNESEGFKYIDENSSYYKEKATSTVAVVRENIKVLVPTGYEELAKAHISDLINCRSLLSDFFGGIKFPYNEIIMKIYISTDDSNLGSSSFGKIIYRRSEKNINFDLQDVIKNNPGGFLYNSNTNYCANSHELTHAFFHGSPLPSFADEGLAQFTQKYNQGDTFAHINCEATGYKYYDEEREYSDMSSDNILDYNTAMCFINELVETYGWNNFYLMLDRLHKFQTGELEWTLFGTYHFVKDILENIYGNEVLEILMKYGIEEEDYLR